MFLLDMQLDSVGQLIAGNGIAVFEMGMIPRLERQICRKCGDTSLLSRP